MRETFADIFGCLAGGPRFGNTLMDFLAADRAKVRDEQRASPAWGRYPARWMRIALVAETLRQMKFKTDGDQLAAAWKTEFGDPAHNADLKDDFEAVVTAILNGPYEPLEKDGHATLNGVLSFRRDAIGDAMDTGVAEGIRGAGGVSHATAPEFVAAARLLYERMPAEYKTKNYADTICSFIDQFAPKGTRGTVPKDLDAAAAADALEAEQEDL